MRKNPYDRICSTLADGLREALAPFAHLTDAEIEARPDLTPPEAKLIIGTRRILASWERQYS
jgi:hypothetical protein